MKVAFPADDIAGAVLRNQRASVNLYMISGTKRRVSPTPAPPDAGPGLLIGYARVSTEDQKLDLQRDALFPARLSQGL